MGVTYIEIKIGIYIGKNTTENIIFLVVIKRCDNFYDGHESKNLTPSQSKSVPCTAQTVSGVVSNS